MQALCIGFLFLSSIQQATRAIYIFVDVINEIIYSNDIYALCSIYMRSVVATVILCLFVQLFPFH